MRGRSTCFRHSGGAVKRARLTAARLSGDLDRIQRAEMRAERNRLRVLWRRDPREPGRTIMLDAADEATCRAWAARQGFQLDLLDRDLPAFADACRWIWARMSRGLISDDDLTAKIARLRNGFGGEPCIRSFVMSDGRLVPVVRPKRWKASSVKRSRERTDRIATARKRAEEEAGDDAVAAASWIAGALPSWRRPASRGQPSSAGSTRSILREAFMSRMFVKQVLQTLSDDQARPGSGSRPGASFTGG